MSADYLDLEAYLADLRVSGRRVPCLEPDPRDRACWTSDDAAEQQLAARLCVGCAGITACRRYIREHPAEWGVYAGSTDRDRRRSGVRS